MCMFNYKNKSSFKALAKGVEFFECGACPECLQKKSRKWALRCGMEALVSQGVMVTLTYDTYKNEKTLEENPVDTSLHVNKKHCQDFLKRLRKRFPARTVKYLLTAEYGKKTHRAHYHALLFGVTFSDLIPLKKSKRNNQIFRSKTLEDIWQHGICTVDATNLTSKIARYCTKYCAKDAGVDDTFMLFSRGIGEQKLLERFNGLSYWIEGREYSIPREIWQKYIEKKYNIPGYSRYIPIRHIEDTEKRINTILNKAENNLDFSVIYHTKKLFNIELAKTQGSPVSYHRQMIKREIYAHYRDNDYLYKRYLEYWKAKNKAVEFNRPTPFERISALPDKKYWSYKQKALIALQKRAEKRQFIPPRSNCSGFLITSMKEKYHEKSFAPLSRHYTANDTFREVFAEEWKELRRIKRCLIEMTSQPLEVSPF